MKKETAPTKPTESEVELAVETLVKYGAAGGTRPDPPVVQEEQAPPAKPGRAK